MLRTELVQQESDGTGQLLHGRLTVMRKDFSRQAKGVPGSVRAYCLAGTDLELTKKATVIEIKEAVLIQCPSYLGKYIQAFSSHQHK